MNKHFYSILSIILFSFIFLVGCHESYLLSEEELDSIKEDYLEENASNYVREHYWIDEIYSKSQIWDYTTDTFKEEMIEYIRDNYDPEEIYPYLEDYIYDNYEPEEIYPELEPDIE